MPQHGVNNEQGLNGLQLLVQHRDFLHQRVVNGQATGRVNQQHINVMTARVVECGACNIKRRAAGVRREPLGPGLLGHGFQLLDGSGAVDVSRDGQHLLLALFDQVLGQLGRGRGFARPLQAGHQNDGGRLCSQVEIGDAADFVARHGGGKFAVHHAHQSLPWRKGAGHICTERFFFHSCDEFTNHRQGDVCLKQSHAHLAQHVLNIAFGNAGLTPHGLDQSAKSFREIGCHMNE